MSQGATANSTRLPAAAPAGSNRSWLIETVIVLALFAVTAFAASRMQTVTMIQVWDADEYFRTTEQIAARQTPTRAAPYVYRLAEPWLVAQWWPHDIARGYRIVNLTATAATSVLLLFWLRMFIDAGWARLIGVALFVVAWHAPARFTFYYPVYVDPPFLASIVAALMVCERIARAGTTAGRTAVLAALCALGALVRETMALIPLALAADAVRRPELRRAAAAALAATAAAIVFTHLIVVPRETGYTFMDAALAQLTGKPLFTWVLAWFIAFGPVLVLPIFAWRNSWRVLAARPYLAIYLALCAGLAFAGGMDTERLLYWSMPVVLLLAASAMVALRHVLNSTYLTTVLVIAQAVSGRIFWSIPSPSLAVHPMDDTPASAMPYAILNRLFVIDDFHWNLYSNFGSRPFHAVLLAYYVVLSAGLLLWMRRRVRGMGK